jgi:hypothetical protein
MAKGKGEGRPYFLVREERSAGVAEVSARWLGQQESRRWRLWRGQNSGSTVRAHLHCEWHVNPTWRRGNKRDAAGGLAHILTSGGGDKRTRRARCWGNPTDVWAPMVRAAERVSHGPPRETPFGPEVGNSALCCFPNFFLFFFSVFFSFIFFNLKFESKFCGKFVPRFKCTY